MDELFKFNDSEGDDDEVEQDTDEDTNQTDFVPDPSTVAFLDQEAAAFAEISDEFEQLYGFRHDCHCDEDYTSGKLGEVTECYAGMIVDSLATCARFKYENKQLKLLVEQLMTMNDELVTSLEVEQSPDGGEL